MRIISSEHTERAASHGIDRIGTPPSVHGHEKVLVGGQVEVPVGGRVGVLAGGRGVVPVPRGMSCLLGA
ncbi:hypothetical protein FAGKG844_830010 [Frankia sp. AgKG'84/4]